MVNFEQRLIKLREGARILFTVLPGARSLPVVTTTDHLDVDELYRRAVKLVQDYETCKVGSQLGAAWKRLQIIADKLGRLQAG